MFFDLNSYFASVEQQEQPELRGRPTAVAPLYADTTFVIAASYEAKAYGVKCGVMVRDAKRMCPDLQIVSARPPLYAAYHKKILEALETVLPILEVHSIDEMSFRLLGDERSVENSKALARRLKEAVRTKVGECLTSSIGVAPNSFLAKVATEMEKPNGLVVLEASDLPNRLLSLPLTAFPGLNTRMEARLNAAGVFTTEQMCRASKQEIYRAFGSVMGERWWYLLRGVDLQQPARKRKSLSHSHILPPEMRTDEGCRDVLLRLLHKAAARLRAENLWTTSMIVHVSAFEKSWEQRVKLPPTQDSVTLTEWFNKVWPERDFIRPRGVGVTFVDLHEHEQVTLSLFDNTNDRALLNRAVDSVNQRYGKNKIYLAALEKVKDTASEKIAFNKTWLFEEGKGDNQWLGQIGAQIDLEE